MEFLQAVARELDYARLKHAPLNSHHEAYAVILEELDEYWDEVKKRRSQRDPALMRFELIQVAAMACRAATDSQAMNTSELLTQNQAQQWLMDRASAAATAQGAFTMLDIKKDLAEKKGWTLNFLELAELRKAERIALDAANRLEVARHVASVIQLMAQGGSIRIYTVAGELETELSWEPDRDPVPF